MTTQPTMVPCPTCRTQHPWADNPWRPFCCERCRLIDLGAWADEAYRVPGEPLPQPDSESDDT